MKTRLLLLFGIGLAMSTMTAQAVITDVSILPEEPTAIDPITIITSGVEGSGGVVITNSNFLIDGTSLELDIFLDVGVFTVITPWSHPEDIGTLLMGTYDLTVNTIVELQPVLNDTYFISFEVVPEPTTAFLFGSGVVFILRKKHKQKKLNR